MKSTKTVLTSLLMVGLVAALIGGATYAVFSDTEESLNNDMIAGTIDLEVNTQNPWTDVTWADTLHDMKPGVEHPTAITVKNVGLNEMAVYKLVTIQTVSGGILTEPECDEGCGVYDQQTGLCGSPYVPVDDIAPDIAYTMTVDLATIIPSPAYLGRLTAIHGHWIYLGTLAPGASMAVVQTYTLDYGVTNYAQGDDLIFDVTFYGVQTVGGAPAPSDPTSTPYTPPS